VFDLDDTLFLERDYVKSGFDAAGSWASKRLGLESFAERAMDLFLQGHRGDIFDRVLHEAGQAPEPSLIAQLVHIYRTHMPNIHLLPDALECLLHFRPKADLALITDGHVVSQRRKVRALGLQHSFHCIVFTERWGRECCKPNPRAFEYVRKRTRAASYAYIGDNPVKDFHAPLRMGWTTVRVRRPEGLYGALPAASDATPAFEIRELSCLPSLLEAGSG
jgi:putative hydrolase of the HAD superfamily